MIKVDAQLAMALTNLRVHPDFKTLVDAIGKDSQDTMEKLLGHTDLLQIGRAQGRTTAYTELLKIIYEAPQTLEKFKNLEKTQ